MLLIKPYLGCNLSCSYCYEGELRRITKPKLDYDLGKMFIQMEANKTLAMSLHGGEPLCLPKPDIDKLLAKMVELTGKSSIQTNGLAIDQEYIDMFLKYKTSIGISFDGSGELSGSRMNLANTDKVEQIILNLKDNSIPTSLLCVINKANAGTEDKLTKFKAWLDQMHTLGITGRLNPCTGSDYGLSNDRMKIVYLELAQLMIDKGYCWSPFQDMIKRLKGESAVCLFMGCDIFHTDSATVLLGDGSITNCMRTNKTDIVLQSPIKLLTRDEILQEIPQEQGGCQGCDFFYACHGGCPSSAEDWRDKTPMCDVWKSLFTFYQKIFKAMEVKLPDCKAPVTNSKERPGHADGHGDSPHGDHTNATHGDSGRK